MAENYWKENPHSLHIFQASFSPHYMGLWNCSPPINIAQVTHAVPIMTIPNKFYAQLKALSKPLSKIQIMVINEEIRLSGRNESVYFCTDSV